jgi:hypothetical protein
MSIWVESDADTTLVLRTADGHVRCDDDSGGGTSPAIDDAWVEGEIPIWVGAFDASGAGAAFTLHVDRERSITATDVPTACGSDATRADRWGAVPPGARVLLGRHTPFSGVAGSHRRAVDESTDWAEAMEAFVGREARVTYRVGSDGADCAIVRVDADGGQWNWRVRDLRPAP